MRHPDMPDRFPLRFRATERVLPEGVLPGDLVVPDFANGRVLVIRELVPNYGRWLGHLQQGNITPVDLSSEEAASMLAAMLGDPPPRPRAGRFLRRWLKGA